MFPQSLLLVEDDPQVRRGLSEVFTRRGITVEAVADGEAALQILSGRRFELYFLDIHLPGMDGLEVLKFLRSSDPSCAVVMMTAFASIENAIAALRLGAADFILKPFDIDQVLLVVGRIAEGRRLRDDNFEFARDARRHDFGSIITLNPAFRALLDSLRRVTGTNSTILITGESGTGKELVARAIHNNSPRADRPMITVNCGAIPASLMESEFFGHVKGAFTGAVADTKGYFERAHGSTLFLDEIGELGIDLQVKLLRVLQERQISRVGNGKPINLDFRLIAATQRDLARDAAEGLFRQDLFYRLNVFPVCLPPLRERPEDIPPLVHNILGRISRKGMHVSPQTLKFLAGYSWPGNVRELENVIERAALLANGDTIQAGDLPPEVRGIAPGRPGGIAVQLPPEATDYKAVMREVADLVRRQLIVRVLAEQNGNVTRTAAALGMSRRYLITVMQEQGLRAEGEEE